MARGTWGGVGDRHPYKVNIKWTAGTSVQQTGFHMRATGAEIGAAQEVADEVADFVNDSFRTILTTDNRILGVDVVDMVSFEGGTVSPANLAGSIAYGEAGSTPDFIAVTTALKSELRTRYGQGRMFLPIIGEYMIDRNRLSAAGAAAIQGVIDAMVERYTGGGVFGYRMVNVHGAIDARPATPSRPIRPAIPPSWYDVVSLRLNTNVTALKSRKSGVGS